jgi:hypothetical protein
MASDKVVENLKKLQDEHRKHMDDIHKKIEDIEVVPKAKALVGKCFKYRNGHFFGSYTKGWTYKHIVSSNGSHVTIDMFETDGPNKVDFVFDRTESANYFNHQALVPITLKEYNKQFKKMINAIVRYNERKII